MAITIKNEHEIALMRESGRLLALVHEEMRKELKEGMTTKDIDRICETMIRDFGCIPNFLNYQGFPASVCVSINDEVVHGIPSKKRYIENGDIVSLDAKKILYLVTHFLRPRLSTEDTSFECKIFWLYAHFLYSFTYISGI